MQRMGGDLRVKSKLEKGSNFILAFPAKIAREVAAVTNLEGEDSVKGIELLAGKRYLVVEDVPENAFLISTALARYRIKTTACRSAVVALELYKKAPLSVDGMMTDLRMPIMSGQSLIAEVRKHERETLKRTKGFMPIVVVTAETSADEKRLCLAQYGASEFLLKPIKIRDLAAALVRLHSATSGEVAGEKKRVLIVDDDVMGSKFMAMVLCRVGHICTRACSISNAMIMLEEEKEYDAVLLDNFLGDGTGADFVRRAEEMGKTKGRKMPKVISVSGNSLEEQKSMYEGMAMHGYLQKPVRKQDVLDMLSSLQ